MVHKNYKRNMFLLGIVAILACHLGCDNVFTGKGKASGEKVVARVNDYEIFVSDFALGADAVFAGGKGRLTGKEIKDDILKGLITQKFLIREAQQQGFDKQKAFIKEIERYWEQALLKSLLQKKSKEIAEGIIVGAGEVKEEYLRRKRNVFAQVVAVKSYESARMLSSSGSNFDGAKEGLGEEIVSKDKAQWWLSGDLPLRLEKRLFALEPEEISPPIIYDGSWFVAKVFEVRNVKMPPFRNVASQIEQELAVRKEEEALKEWIADLREKASVEIYPDVLNDINLKSLQDLNH